VSRAILSLLGGALCGLAWLLATTPLPAPALAAPRPAQTSYAAASGRERWAVDFLARLGNVAPTPEIVTMVVEWTMAEDSSDGALARNNPLNTTLCLEGAMTGAINGDGACGVQGYATWEDGIEANARTLEQGNFETVRAAILANDAEGARQALWASPWAASHYGYGSAWPRVGVTQAPSDVRSELVNYALSLQGIPYVRGGRSASGGDCSGTMQHIYLTVTGRDIGATTFSQYPQLEPVGVEELRPGDLWYGVFPSDEHTGMVADVDGDGRFDLIHNGADAEYMHVTYDFLNTYLGAHTKGYRRAI
jgi:cell wall-associated NlpC family hydrolase